MAFLDTYLLGKSEQIVLAEGQEQEVLPIELAENGNSGNAAIVGNVTSGGLGVADATVKVFDDAGLPVAHSTTDSTGDYSITGLAAGDYHVTVIKNGYLLPVVTDVTLAAEEIATVDLTITADPNADLNKIYGIVSDTTTSAGIENARVILTQEIVGVTTIIAETFSNVDGEYMIYDLDDGDYSIFASKQGYYSSDPAAVAVSGGDITESNIELTGNPADLKGTISGIITDESTNPLANAIVGLYSVVLGVETLIATTMTNADGRYLFAAVDAGTYLVKSKVEE